MNKNKKRNKNEKVEAVEKWLKYGFIGLIVLVILGVAISWVISNTITYVATVGTEKISLGEFNMYLENVKYSMLLEAGIEEGTPEAETFWNTANFNGLSAIEEAKRRTLDGLKEQKIMVNKAKEYNLKLEKEDKEYIDQRVGQLIESNDNSRSKTDKYLKETYGITLSEYKKMNEDVILAQKAYRKEIENMNLTDEDYKKKYEADKSSYDTVTVRHILVSTLDPETKEPLDEEKKKEAEEKAKDIMERIKAGEDMKKLAKELSDDKPAVEENEGEYKFNKYGNFVPEFMDWAFKANVGDIDIVETYYGYHVMRLENRETTDFEEVKEYIEEEVENEKFVEKMEEWKKDPKYDVKKDPRVYDSIK
ncbi:MAG TPA: hypothetical protein GXX14_06350 [Clostridiaceae bacterium]|nr:hypothetical protein [Clostridiaceae bacterium]